jgi:hypothetical protein
MVRLVLRESWFSNSKLIHVTDQKKELWFLKINKELFIKFELISEHKNTSETKSCREISIFKQS